MNVSTKAIGSLILNVKQASKFKFLSISFLVFFLSMFLESCSKNTDQMPGQNNIQAGALDQSSSSRTNSSMVVVPFEETLFVPCGNGGTGENVALTGSTNFVYQMSWNEHGFNMVYHTNSRGITGVGLSSGELFVGSAGTNGTVMGSWVNHQWIGTTIERMRVIGNNTTYVVKYKYQLVVNPEGKVTVSTTEKSIDCIR